MPHEKLVKTISEDLTLKLFSSFLSLKNFGDLYYKWEQELPKTSMEALYVSLLELEESFEIRLFEEALLSSEVKVLERALKRLEACLFQFHRVYDGQLRSRIYYLAKKKEESCLL